MKIGDVSWIVENFSEGEDITNLIACLRDKGIPTTVIGRKNGFEYKHITHTDQCLVFYGSINMARIIENHCKTCKPVTWADPTSFLCSSYYPRFSEFLFNDKHAFMKIKDLRTSMWDVYSKFGRDAMIFIRPDSGDKTFSGQLLDVQDFESFFVNAIKCSATDEDQIVVSTPKNILGEWRYLVSQNEIIAVSCYRFHQKTALIPSAPEPATKLVKKILDSAALPAIVCAVDIAEDSDHNYWLMEFNSFNSCGLYAMNVEPIVNKITQIAWHEYYQKTP
jgi:hypothetical protein